MRRLSLFFVLLLAAPCLARSGDSPRSTDTTLARPVIEAGRLLSPIAVDGNLSEREWQRPGLTHFTQKDPNEGSEPSQRTEVWVAYDDAALYVAARLYDNHPDSIISRIGRRDADLNSDGFYVGIDSYHDRRSGYYFSVYAGGSVSDGTMFNDDWDDNTWDGVWDAATRIDERGWTVEMRIPYSQLRFPKQEAYTWGINFIRSIPRNQERDDFVLVPRKESGWVSRFADLTGLSNINPPRKLEILPYVVSSGKFLQHAPGDPFVSGHDFGQNIGGDLKLGLGNNLTLSATINPDFGQVEVDPAVVNLTQFETFFDEKRPFFVESSNLFDFGYGGANNNWGFNFGNPSFFYSRRIGRPPAGGVQHFDTDGEGDVYSDVPDHTHIIGAAKLSGKISDGWSIGGLQAFTAREYGHTDSAGVRFADVTEPFTSYSVLRSLREFNQGRQGLGLITTATVRDLNHDYLEPSFNRGAYTLGVDGWTMLDSEQLWVITGWLSATRVEGSTDAITNLQNGSLHYYQRPDISYVSLDPVASSLSGYGGRVALNKQKGNTYLNAAVGVITPGFESSDLGFMFRTDVVNSHLVLGYRWFEPDGIFRRKSLNLATFRSYDFGGRKTGEGYFLFGNAQFTNYWSVNSTVSFNPATLDTRNTRGGPAMMNTNGYVFNLFANSDSRSSLVYNLGLGGGRTESGGYRISAGPGVEWKPSAGLALSVSPEFTRDVTIAQWVMKTPDPAASATYGNRYLFAKLDYREISSSIRVDWTFTPKLTLQLYLQPLFAVGSYTEFKELRQPGTYTFNQYGSSDSMIYVADRDFRAVLDPRNPADTTQVRGGEYVADPDGASGSSAARFTFGNPNFNALSLRGNAILRWEFLPGSTMFFVWTHQRSGAGTPGTFDFASDFRNLMSAPGDNIFLVKMSYWWNP